MNNDRRFSTIRHSMAFVFFRLNVCAVEERAPSASGGAPASRDWPSVDNRRRTCGQNTLSCCYFDRSPRSSIPSIIRPNFARVFSTFFVCSIRTESYDTIAAKGSSRRRTVVPGAPEVSDGRRREIPNNPRLRDFQ